ncbi:MAG: heptosyltransferase-2 [Planctomycetota bacterium]
MRLRGGERLLVRIPAWLGDAVMAEPLLRALRPWCDGGELSGGVTLAGPGALLDLFHETLPGAKLLPMSKSEPFELRSWRGHDVALLLTGSFRSAWMAWRAGISERIGWQRDGRGLLLTSSAVPARERGGVPFGCGVRGRSPRYLPRAFGASCVELGGLLGVAVTDTRPQLHATVQERSDVFNRLTSSGIDPLEPFLLLNAGGRSNSSKLVPAPFWTESIKELRRNVDLPVVIVAGFNEEQQAEACGQSIPGSVVLTDPIAKLPELLALCATARLVLTGDVGPRHLAVASGADLVCVLASTDPRHTADFLERTRIIRGVVSCGPCHRDICPKSGALQNRCMTELTPASVASAALELLQSPSK